MRGTVAKALRKLAYQQSQYIPQDMRHVEKDVHGTLHPARIGRRFLRLIGHKRQYKTYEYKDAGTIYNHPQGIRAAYRRLKRQYKAGLLAV